MVLSTFRVNTTLDTVAVNLSTGKDASGHISLRSAIMASNASSNKDRIILPTGTFPLTILRPGEDDDDTGDLNIKHSLTILGKGASRTIIDGNHIARVFDIVTGVVSISKLTIQHGQADHGSRRLERGGDGDIERGYTSNNLAIGADGAPARTARPPCRTAVRGNRALPAPVAACSIRPARLRSPGV